MIQSFKCEGMHPRRSRSFASIAERKLAQLDAAQTLDFMRAPPQATGWRH